MSLHEWLKRGQRVRAHVRGPGGRAHGEGKVIAYSEGPQVLIEGDDGSRLWWRADLCTETEETVGDERAVSGAAVEGRGPDGQERRRRARVEASAFDLLSASKHLLWCAKRGFNDNNAWDALEAAVAKADGEYGRAEF